jgi:23S rRNA (uracil1939-C5)-methyltransferase
LRVSPSGERGLWLDFANLDVKMLFDERQWLSSLLDENVFIEIGQRRKALQICNGELKLRDPILKPWFETYPGIRGEAVALDCYVSSFTQPGFRVNQLLCREAIQFLSMVPAERWVELGSGIGNFTLPMAEIKESVVAIENDRLAVNALKANVLRSGNSSKVEILSQDFRGKKFLENLEFDGLFCDPPRSGLGGFFSEFDSAKGSRVVESVVYVSCYLESCIRDLGEFLKRGFKLKDLKAVDQFPQSSHCEYLALLTRSP